MMFRRLAAAGLVTIISGSAGAASAQDEAAVGDIFDWTGFYVGGHVGGASTPGNTTSTSGPLFPGFIILPPAAPIITVVLGLNGTLNGDSGANTGLIAGGQIGYNWQRDNVVLGLEGDAVRVGLPSSTGTATRFSPPFDQTVTVNFGGLDWMASVRGRAGVTADNTLFYLTAGGAVAQIGGTTTTVVNGSGIGIPAGTFTATSGGPTTAIGWTVGGGIEVALNDNWSIGGEYRHTDFGNRAVSFTVPDGFGGTFATGNSTQHLMVGRFTVSVNFHPN
jgi:outer membrane immunogenic protein